MLEKNDKQEPKMSIIIPAYNIKDYLNECVQSLVEQDYNNIEIIIIDDGSTDGTSTIINEIAEAYPQKIFKYHINNSGVSAARNYGIKKASGDWLIFVDGDDCVSPEYVNAFVRMIKSSNIDMGIVDYFRVFGGESISISSNDESVEIMNKEEIFERIVDSSGFTGYIWNKCFNKKIVDKNKILFNERINILEDYVFCVDYINVIDNAAYMHKPLYSYKVRVGSATNKINSRREVTQLEAYEKIMSVLINYTGNYVKKIACDYSNLMIAVYYSGALNVDGYSKDSINDIISKINRLDARLTWKHEIMYFIMKYFPRISYLLQKINR